MSEVAPACGERAPVTPGALASLLCCPVAGRAGARDARVLTVASRNGRGTKPLSSVRQN